MSCLKCKIKIGGGNSSIHVIENVNKNVRKKTVEICNMQRKFISTILLQFLGSRKH
jgi:hypothetical protein